MAKGVESRAGGHSRLSFVVMIAILALSWMGPASAAVVASLDRPTVFVGETVRLTITGDASAGSEAPDYSVLANHFYLADTTTSSEFRFINGRQQVTTRWSIMLEPKTAGDVTIPSLNVNGERTEPLALKVLPVSDDGEAEDLLLEMTVTPENPYVHGQALLSLKLYNVHPLTEARLIEPVVAGVVMERLGEDLVYTATRNGKRYRVNERRFALFPERSGTINITPAGFRGRVADQRSSSSIFNRGRRVSLNSESLVMEVRGRAAAFPDNEPWLPARALTITDNWPAGESTFRVGEPMTRRIVLRASGLHASQLPEIEVPQTGSFKVYPDQGLTASRNQEGWVVGEREQSYAIVPTESGNLTLPAIRIAWWNTGTEQLEYAEIPERQILVQPAVAPVGGLEAESGVLRGDAEFATRPSSGWPFWPIVAGLLAVMWLLTAMGWIRERRGREARPRRKRPADREAPAADFQRVFTRACNENDPHGAASSLLGWARTIIDEPILNLGTLAARIEHKSLADETRQLDRALYSGTGDQWQRGSELLTAARAGLRKNNKRAKRTTARPLLPPLYPDRSR